MRDFIENHVGIKPCKLTVHISMHRRKNKIKK